MEVKNKKPQTVSDQEIIEMYWARNEKAIETTDSKYGRYLYVIAYNILSDSMDCEECLNDTYLCTWNKIPPQRPNVLQNFLSKIARDVAVDKYRKNTASKRVPSELISSLDELDECVPAASSVEEEVLVKEMSTLLNKYLRSCTRREEFIFVCRYYYADSISSIAEMMNISENTVFRDLAKLRRGFRDILEKEGFINE